MMLFSFFAHAKTNGNGRWEMEMEMERYAKKVKYASIS